MENNNDNKESFWQTIKDNPKILETVSICLGPCSYPTCQICRSTLQEQIGVSVVASNQKKSAVS